MRITFENILNWKVAGFSSKLKGWMRPLERVRKISYDITDDETKPRTTLHSDNFEEIFFEHHIRPIMSKFKKADIYLTQPKNEELGSLAVFVVARDNFVFLAGIRKVEEKDVSSR